jgi:CheY-like chemotaxis protein
MDTISKTILIIEDDIALRTALTEKLFQEKYTTLSAQNGEEGLTLALQKHPDLILLDILMPKMDGMNVMKKLREDEWGSSVPIFIFTNVDPNDHMLTNVMKDHPTYYIIKSNTTLEEIVEKIKDILYPVSPLFHP